ncbi:unnamed protein product [Strongylus vulgaris]|uniref:PAZ domain-containing protein n=1 Tax=Strongylus vulgaris TaxID=40348 RepID=A0A3P7I260_STRVU|nr:unnamed protein product [Strongylus vulgaris]
MEIWPGFETAVRHYEQDELMLCIENRFKMIRTESVWEIMCAEDLRARHDRARFQAAMEEIIVGQTVFARYNNKMYRITSISYDMTPQSTFARTDGTVTTLSEYFEKQYDLSVLVDTQPVLVNNYLSICFTEHSERQITE